MEKIIHYIITIIVIIAIILSLLAVMHFHNKAKHHGEMAEKFKIESERVQSRLDTLANAIAEEISGAALNQLPQIGEHGYSLMSYGKDKSENSYRWTWQSKKGSPLHNVVLRLLNADRSITVDNSNLILQMAYYPKEKETSSVCFTLWHNGSPTMLEKIGIKDSVILNNKLLF